MGDLNIGLLLMVVGMATVFAILLIIIYLGKGLILLVNKYAPEEVVVKKQRPSVVTQVFSNTSVRSGNGGNRFGNKHDNTRLRKGN